MWIGKLPQALVPSDSELGTVSEHLRALVGSEGACELPAAAGVKEASSAVSRLAPGSPSGRARRWVLRALVALWSPFLDCHVINLNHCLGLWDWTWGSQKVT